MAIVVRQSKITVTTSGNAVALASSETRTPSAIITAGENNNGTVYVGDSNVDAASELGQSASAGESVILQTPTQYGTEEVLDLTKIYVDSTSNGDVVVVTYYEREG